MRRVLAAGAILGLLAFGGWFALRAPTDGTTGPAPAGRYPETSPPGPRTEPKPEDAAPSDARRAPADATLPQRFAGLRDALLARDPGRVRSEAADLRRLLRTDPAAWDEAAACLANAALPPDVRAALALVLGTIETPRTDAVLLAALAVEGGSPEPRRSLLLALGATREPPDDDEVFGLGDTPWAEEGPGGLGITVRRAIGDPSTRGALTGALRDAEPTVRRAAAAALRHSLDHEDAHAAFVEALRGEADDGPATLIAEALVVRDRHAPAAEAREATLREVIAKASLDGFDGVRFRITDDLRRVPLPRDSVDVLLALAASDREFGVRVFALDVLSRSAVASGDDVAEAVSGLLVRLLEASADPAIRDAAATRLRELPVLGTSSSALLAAVEKDTAWNVRHAALETIAARGDPALARALEVASGDDDARVRTRASELREQK